MQRRACVHLGASLSLLWLVCRGLPNARGLVFTQQQMPFAIRDKYRVPLLLLGTVPYWIRFL